MPSGKLAASCVFPFHTGHDSRGRLSHTQEEEARWARRALDGNRAHVAFLDHQVARRAAARLEAKQEQVQVWRLYTFDPCDAASLRI